MNVSYAANREQEVATFEAKWRGVTLALGLVIGTGWRACGQRRKKRFRTIKKEYAHSQTHYDEEKNSPPTQK